VPEPTAVAPETAAPEAAAAANPADGAAPAGAAGTPRRPLLGRRTRQRDREPAAARTGAGKASYDRPAPSPGVNPIGSLNAPGRATVEGRVRTVEIRPVQRSSVLAVEIADSTGDLTALFYGRSHIPGIICGSKVRFRGPVGVRETGPVMINPAYELLSTGGESPPRRDDSN
jgi:hypothetical protein